MAEVVHVFICDRAYEDDRGQPCVIGMFDHIWAPQFPLNHPHMAIAVQMLGHQHETYDLTVNVVNPENKVILSASYDAPEPLSGIGQGFVSLALTDTPFETPGRYTVRISSEGRVVASKPLVLQHAVDPARALQTHR